MAKKNAEVKQQVILRNAFIMGFVLILIIILVAFRAYNQKKKAEREKSLRQIEKYINEIELLRANIKMEITQTHQKYNISINKEALNMYLLNPLTDRELEVLSLISSGKTNKEIADKLYVSVNTIKTHLLKIYEKLDVKNRTQAVVKASDLEILNERV